MWSDPVIDPSNSGKCLSVPPGPMEWTDIPDTDPPQQEIWVAGGPCTSDGDCTDPPLPPPPSDSGSDPGSASSMCWRRWIGSCIDGVVGLPHTGGWNCGEPPAGDGWFRVTDTTWNFIEIGPACAEGTTDGCGDGATAEESQVFLQGACGGSSVAASQDASDSGNTAFAVTRNGLALADWFFNAPATASGGNSPELEVFHGGVWNAPTSITQLGAYSIRAFYAFVPLSGDPWRIASAPTNITSTPDIPAPQSGVIA